MEIEKIDTNPAIITEKKEGDNLIKETTYKEPKIQKEIINIPELQAKIDKYTRAKEQWEANIKPQDINTIILS